MKVLITSPSINEIDNIGGVSSITKMIINLNTKVNYELFIIGKKDVDKRNLRWFLKQISLPIRFYCFVGKSNSDIMHLNIPLMPLSLIRDYVIVIIAQLKRKPIILHIHGGKYLNQCSPNWFYYHLIFHLLCIAKKIIVLSIIEKDQLCKMFPSINKNKVIPIPNAILVSNTLKEKNYRGKLKLIFIGRIVRDKGFPEIEKSLETLLKNGIEYEYSLCGVGNYINSFYNNISKELKRKIRYYGIVSGENKYDVLSDSHIFILPSYFEGLPLSLIEAMGAGIVPICTPAGSIPGVISDKENGFLVPFHDEDSIVEIIMQLDKDRETMKKISVNAHEHIKENYSIDRYIERLNNVYEEVTSE
jgi:glycosyltransferase involved in cell wall biosynthesis